MTNNQCYCYGVKAISNILKAGIKIDADTFYREIYYLWDFYAEEEMRGNKDFMKQLFEYRNEQESIYKDKK